MASNPRAPRVAPRRGEIWTAYLEAPVEIPTTLVLPPGETGLPGVSCLRGHFIMTLPKSQLIERLPRALSANRMRQMSAAIRRSYDPDAP